MAPKIDFTNPLHSFVAARIDKAKGSKWEITRENLGLSIIRAELGKSTVSTFLKFLPENQQALEEQIQKFQKKIASAEIVIVYLRSNSEATDPRVTGVLNKIYRLDLNDPHSFEKIEKYTRCLSGMKNQKINPSTSQDLTIAKFQLNKLRMESLQATQEIKICEISDNELFQFYPKGVNLAACLQAGREQTSINFLFEMLKMSFENKLDNCSVEFIEELINKGHEQACANLDLLDELRPSLAQIFESDEFQTFCRVKLNQNDCLTLSNLNLDSISDSFAALLAAKRQNDLTNITALIRFGDRHLMVSIDRDDVFYLFNQHGDNESFYYPYITAFGKLEHAASFLYEVLVHELKNRPFTGPIAIAAACNRDEGVYIPQLPEDHFLAPPPPLTMETLLPPVFHLQNAIDCLSSCTEEGFFAALDGISQTNEFSFRSPINGQENINIQDRIFFQLYHIHDKETPSKINRSDTAWGTNAFQSEVLSTPDEKLRAAQRVQVEVLMLILNDTFENLHNDIQKAQNDPRIEPFIRLSLEALEKLNLHPNDLPKGEKNLAHCLFGKLYRIYLAAWEKNKTMVHPHDGRYNKDFGRNALVGEAKDSIPAAYKLQALQELMRSLKDTWKI